MAHEEGRDKRVMNQNVELILQVDTPLAKAEGILDSQNRLADAELLQHQ